MSLILEMNSITVICNYDVDSTALKSALQSSFTKPTLFVIAASGTNIVSGLTVTSCQGMNTGGVFQLTTGSLTNSDSSYTEIIAYQGCAYSISSDASVTATNVNLTSSFSYYGGMAYISSSASLTLTTATITSNQMYLRSLFEMLQKASLTLTSATISSNTASSVSALFYTLEEATITITSSTITGNSCPDYMTTISTSSTITMTGVTMTGNSATKS
jgi:hypothetical protein